VTEQPDRRCSNAHRRHGPPSNGRHPGRSPGARWDRPTHRCDHREMDKRANQSVQITCLAARGNRSIYLSPIVFARALVRFSGAAPRRVDLLHIQLSCCGSTYRKLGRSCGPLSGRFISYPSTAANLIDPGQDSDRFCVIRSIDCSSTAPLHDEGLRVRLGEAACRDHAE
jgi:hypothetical protein